MIAVLDKSAPISQRADVVRAIEDAGLRVLVSDTATEHLIGVLGPGAAELADQLRGLAGVKEVRPHAPPYTRVARDLHPTPTTVRVGRSTGHAPVEQAIGDTPVVVAAGPCAVESHEQVMAAAKAVKAAGATMLRGGAFKPRTSPYSFQGLEVEGLKILAAARAETGLPVVTEVVATTDVDVVAEHADMLQIGARNMQNFRLLQACGEQPRPVLLKRGMMSTIEELLCAAEYIVNAGNPNLVLCERGIRTFETSTRNTLDVSAVPVLRQKTHLPVFIDPSHPAGNRDLVTALARAGVAAGADGLLVEVHPDPSTALCDGKQSLTLELFAELMQSLARVAEAVDRPLAVHPQ
ncbi:MAG: 3-deoxy-7-phosphoheptulonate synthase [Planctomycetota bacterium]|jgi:3-deoxy-7-phosphoheptulonate synthase